ncbi:phosphate/phosphite/phosphonate ABC transporter substrate-binding protein [Neogemmobacter tilapiae]|uniref:Phosphate ABC transporter substrate-binding protein n=1 Tax=Neogemmobacter tilapiae TaxID=875041 RepID=A0A918WM71_9RHOB|nr:PhnD/SsuA/transferrin family substrate-binding protein [Gemmobacter tilapiae]GHC59693.1 phosphate ABC transporter substrate-binding protein [Gemmobacter tilapiae]
MIAALGMYDLGDAAPANDRLWALIRDGLGGAGMAAPQALTRGDLAYLPGWLSPDLVLAQTCGRPFREMLHDKVALIGTPDYGLPGCAPGYYRSVFVVRADDPRGALGDFASARFAYNDPMSQSGWAGPMHHAPYLTPALQTGGHRASAQAVAEGAADVAALDAVTWGLLQRNLPELAAQLRVVDETPPAPGLPLISAQGSDAARIFSVVAGAIAALSAGDRAALSLQGLVQIPVSAYLALPPAAPAPKL